MLHNGQIFFNFRGGAVIIGKYFFILGVGLEVLRVGLNNRQVFRGGAQ